MRSPERGLVRYGRESAPEVGGSGERETTGRHHSPIKRRRNLPSCDRRNALDAIEICVLDGHHARLREDLFGEVVDELTVDETTDAVVDDLLAFVAHLLLLWGVYGVYGMVRCDGR